MSKLLLRKYEDTLVRLQGQVAGLERGRARLKWAMPIAVLLCPAGFLVHAGLAFAIVATGGFVWGIGSYIATVHIMADESAIGELSHQIEQLRAKVGSA